MSDAQQVRRAVERFQRGRRWEHSAFPTSSGGLLHTPYPRLGAGQPRTSGGGGDITIGQAPIGELVRLHVHGHLGPGGEPIVWDTVTRRVGFDGNFFPSVEILLPHTAVYGIEGDFSWDTFLYGGRVSLLLNGVGIPGLSPIRAGGTVENMVGRTFTLAQEFVANEGDRLSLWVDHAGDSDQDLHGTIEVATKEPLAVTVPGGITLVYEGAIRPVGEDFVDLPAAVVDGQAANAGDLLVAIVATNFTGGGGISGPSGWTTQEAVSTSGSGDNANITIASRVATGAEAATYRWTHVGAINNIGGVMFLIPAGAVAGTASQAWSNAGSPLPVGPVGAGTLWLAATASELAQSLARASQIEPGDDFPSFAHVIWWQLDDDAVHDLTLGSGGSGKSAYAAIGIGGV